MHFDHAGIATDDAEGLTSLFCTLFDAPLVHEESFDGMTVRFLDLGNGYFELLEPDISTATDPVSTTSRSPPRISRKRSKLPTKTGSNPSTRSRGRAHGATR